MENRKKVERDLENGGAGVYSGSLEKNYILAEDERKEDIVDPDILQRLEELEREEGLCQEKDADDGNDDMDGAELAPEQLKNVALKKKELVKSIQLHRIKKSTAWNRPPRNKDRDFTSKRMGSRSRGRKRERSSVDAMDVDNNTQANNKKLRLRSTSRSRSRPPISEWIHGEGLKDSAQKVKAIKLAWKASNKRNKDARRGESDRVIPTLRPKHLFSGKRGIGKAHRR